MNIEELEAIVDAMAEEGGDMIDALYDTVTLQKDTYCGFICRLREVVRLAKNEQKKSLTVGNATTYAYDPAKTGKSELPDGSAYALESFKADKAKEPTTVGNAAAMCEALESVNKIYEMLCKPCIVIEEVRQECRKARAVLISTPPRNCDKVKDHSDAIGKFEKWMGFSPKTADEQDAFFKEHWFEFAMWLIDMNESEVNDGEK